MDITKITPKQRRIVKEKIKGKTNKEIGQIVYPGAKPESARVQVSGQLNKSHVAKYYEQSKLQALKEHNITWSRIIKPISEALDATTPIKTKTIKRDAKGNVIEEKEHLTFVTSHSIRLSGAKQARELLEIKSMDEEGKEELDKIPEGLSLIEAQRLIFKSK